MDLYYQSYPDDYLDQSAADRASLETPVLIIPGLFGSTANWRGIAKKLSNDCPVIVIDQRNHGRSAHADTNSYLDMVNDLRAFVDQYHISQMVLCGHSMGGKVAMLFSLLHPSYIKKLAVLDIAPVTYQHSHAPFLEELLKVDLSELQSRKDAERALTSVIPDYGTRLFLLQSLAGTVGSFYWRLNLSVLLEFMPQIVGFPNESVTNLESSCDVVLISGGLSDYVSAEGYLAFNNYFINAQRVVIDQAGHWLHAEQPDKVLDALKKFLKDDK